MPDAYIETTILTDVLLKPKTPKQQRAKAALARFQKTMLPVYSIKEFKAGPLRNFVYVHDKLVVTQSLRNTLQAISVLARGSYRQSTSLEALSAAGIRSQAQPILSSGLGSTDKDMADSYRLALISLIIRSWRKRRAITTQVIQDLSCYTEAQPQVGKNGLIDLKPTQCERDEECCLAEELKSNPEMLRALRDAIPVDSGKKENQRRRNALKRLIKRPNDPVDRDLCNDLGDAIFAFFCPHEAVILTTNIRDHQPLAESVGKKAENP